MKTLRMDSSFECIAYGNEDKFICLLDAIIKLGQLNTVPVVELLYIVFQSGNFLWWFVEIVSWMGNRVS